VALSPSAALDPVLRAASLDMSGCPGEGSSSVTVGASSSASGGGTRTVNVPVYGVESGCGAREVGEALYVIAVTLQPDETAPDAYYQEEDSCSGDTSDTYTPVYYDETAGETGYESDSYDSGGDDCSSDTTETYDDGDDCSGDTSDTYDDEADCSSDTSGGRDDSCSSDTTGSSSSSSSDCGGDTSSSSDSSGCGDSKSGSESSCSVAPRRRPRLSFLVLLATAFAVPARRFTRPRLRLQPR
jgi:hypothetical protein